MNVCRSCNFGNTGPRLKTAPRPAGSSLPETSAHASMPLPIDHFNLIDMRSRAPILIQVEANARWPVDFADDQFACGRRFRALNIVERECLAAIRIRRSPGRRGGV
ncbi:hypothetical protein [Mesorhizobium sp. M0590]|uniref:hypothetical protein n=1 Tax=Mesorhizobium sp. M0590 TaxID=2956966 RepID=UPI00333B82B6